MEGNVTTDATTMYMYPTTSSMYPTTEYYYDDYDSSEQLLCRHDDTNAFGAKLSVFYYLIFLLSTLGNSLVLVIIYTFEKLTTVTNIFLVNLVLSGLVFVSSLPFWAVYQQMSSWVFGKAMCKLVGSAYYLGFYSSILFLTLTTFDRYLAVVYALDAPRLRRRSYAAAACVAVWLLSVLACTKNLLLLDVTTDNRRERKLCEFISSSDWLDVALLHQWGRYIQLLLFFLLPLVVIVYCYTRITITVVSSRMVTKFRTVRLIFVIVLLFFSCWAPYNVVVILDAFPAETCERKRALSYARHLTKTMAHLYFCVSPLFYTFVGRKFQNYFRKLLVARLPFLRQHVWVSHSSKANGSLKNEGNEQGTDKTNDC